MKQVIVMRKDLNMRKGKMVAQGAHASMAAIFNKAYKTNDDITIYLERFSAHNSMDEVREWFYDRFTKICVGVNSEEELIDVFTQATVHDVPCALIKDRGITEFKGVPTHTCAAIGPASNDRVDRITGDLKLL